MFVFRRDLLLLQRCLNNLLTKSQYYSDFFFFFCKTLLEFSFIGLVNIIAEEFLMFWEFLEPLGY